MNIERINHNLLIVAKKNLFFLAFLVVNFGFSQSYSDCDGAILLTDSTYTFNESPAGYGEVMEIRGGRHNPYFFEEEHHTVWYKLMIPASGLLSLEIQPHQLKDDYDFIIFKDTLGFCELVRNEKIQPKRSNISRNDLSINSLTGLSATSELQYQQEGIGNPFSRAINVDSGDIYYLVVDNVYEDGKGHDLFWKIVVPEVVEIKPTSFVKVQVLDRDSGNALMSQIEIRLRGVSKYRPPLDKVENGTNAFFTIDPHLKYHIEVESDQYFSFETEVKTSIANDTIIVQALLEKIAVGNKIKIENIYFKGGTAQFLSDSYASLKELRSILKENESLKIEIQGHVNSPFSAPSKSSKKELMDLSVERAEAVYDYLIRRGIHKDRLSFEGFSNAHMVYPYARSAEEQQANRRVEFEIKEL